VPPLHARSSTFRSTVRRAKPASTPLRHSRRGGVLLRAGERIQRARDEGEHLFEWREQHKDGHTYPVEVHLTLVELHGEERVLASVRDITERKRREREYEQIFNKVRGGITINDPTTGEIIEVNDSFCDLLGYSREEILEMGVEGLSASDEGFTLELAREMVREVVETGEPKQTE